MMVNERFVARVDRDVAAVGIFTPTTEEVMVIIASTIRGAKL